MRAPVAHHRTRVSFLVAFIAVVAGGASCESATDARLHDAGPIDGAQAGSDGGTADILRAPDASPDMDNGDRPDWHDTYAMCGFPPCLSTLFAQCPIATPTEAVASGACIRTQLSATQVRVVYTSGTSFLTSRTGPGLDSASSTIYKPDGDLCYEQSGFGPSTIADQQGRTIAELTFGSPPFADITCDGTTTRVLNDCVDLLLTPEAGGYFCSDATMP